MVLKVTKIKRREEEEKREGFAPALFKVLNCKEETYEAIGKWL